MTRDEALQVLGQPTDITFEDLDSVFRAFGFISATPDFETEIYYHPTVRCGRFTARDDGVHVLSDEQREMVSYMINQVVQAERA